MAKSRVRVTSKSIVKASVARPSVVLAVSNLDLLYHSMSLSMICVYRKPLTGGGFLDAVAAFEAKLPSLLDLFFPLAGRIAANPCSGLPEVHCDNQGAELVVGEADVALGSLDYGDLDASLARVGVPVQHAAAVALSVQLVSFTCGGFVVAWCTNHGLVDGHALCMIVHAWSELARSTTGEISAAPNHDRSVFRARAAPSYAGLGELFTLSESEHLVNALTATSSFVVRTYYVEERDLAMLRAQASAGEERGASRVEAVSAYLWKVFASVVGSSDERCRMGWWVNGRPRLAKKEGSMRDYVGNVTLFAVAEATVDAIQRRPLTGVASMVRECIKATATDAHFQELVDWVEENKDKGKGKGKGTAAAKFVETATIGLGSPVLGVTSFASFSLDTDFGFGHAAMAMPAWVDCGRLCCGFVKIIARPPGGDGGAGGSWIFSMSIWPMLAAALDSDEQRFFKPLTAEYLALDQ